jgi:ribosomal RNA-processing protein 12
MESFLQGVTAEVILCTKEVNETARSASFALIARIGEAIINHQSGDDAAVSIDQYSVSIAAGLAGASSHMMSATVLALARLLFQVDISAVVSNLKFRDNIGLDTRHQLVEAVLVLLGSRNREVVKSCLGFIKVPHAHHNMTFPGFILCASQGGAPRSHAHHLSDACLLVR